jgi:serine/alanine adding enzyme
MMPAVDMYRGRADEWDRFVQASEGWSHFHLSGWRKVMEEVFGHECTYLAARDSSGGLEAVLPLVRVRSRLFGHYLVSMPFLNYGGPLGTPAGVQRLVQQAVDKARHDSAKLLELRSRHPLAIDLPVSHRKVTVVLDLPDGDPAPLWDGLKAKVRSQVRRPQKEGVEVKFGADQVEPFYGVFARHMRDLGTPVQSRRLFQAIAEQFPDSVWFGCAYLNGVAVAGGCGFHWNGEFEMTWASSLREHNRIAPNMLLYWRFIERAVEHGLRLFNFGRCTPGGATHRFKQQWGSRDEPLWWYQHAREAEASTPSPDDGAYSWGPRLWQRLPLSIANVVGPRVVQYIP